MGTFYFYFCPLSFMLPSLISSEFVVLFNLRLFVIHLPIILMMMIPCISKCPFLLILYFTFSLFPCPL